MKQKIAACLCVAAFVMTGCRSGKALEGPDAAEADGMVQDPVDPGNFEPPSDDLEPEEKHAAYFQDVGKLEEKRVKNLEGLELSLSRLKLHGLLLELVDNLAAIGVSGDFKKAVEVNKKALVRIRGEGQLMGSDALDMLNNVARRNLEAYASCMTVAKGDLTWCGRVEKTWKGAATGCHALYDIYVLIMGKAYIKNSPCSKVMAKAMILKGEEGVKFCEAVVRHDPGACPCDEAEPRCAYCAAAAGKGNIRACGKVKIGWEDKKRRCCEIFAWRMSWLPSGSGEIEIPEAGALKGDETGCANALRWGLFESLAPALGVPLEGDHPPPGELRGEFLCPVLVYWTEREMKL